MSLLIKKKEGKNKTEHTIENLYLSNAIRQSQKVKVIDSSSKLKIKCKVYCGKSQCRNYE